MGPLSMGGGGGWREAGGWRLAMKGWDGVVRCFPGFGSKVPYLAMIWLCFSYDLALLGLRCGLGWVGVY